MSEEESWRKKHGFTVGIVTFLVLYVSGVVLGAWFEKKDRQEKQSRIEALEERVEKMEKAQEPTCPDKYRKGFKKIGKNWYPILRGVETTNPNAWTNHTKDEVKEAGLSSINVGEECSWFCGGPDSCCQRHSPECHRCLVESRHWEEDEP